MKKQRKAQTNTMRTVSETPNRLIEECKLTDLLDGFNLLQDTLFWIKDKQGRVIHANHCFLEHVGADNLEQIIGLTDYDIFPLRIADQFVQDDHLVIAGGTINERLETNILTSKQICWFSTSKRPLLNRDGEIIGSYGISKHLEKASFALTAIDQLKTPIDYIRKHYMNPINVTELAEIAHLSLSALERRFKKYLSKTPKQFINTIRLENAQHLLLESNLPIATIASAVGFADASYFTRQFVKHVGHLPTVFRENFS